MIKVESYIKKNDEIIQSIENIEYKFNDYFVKFKDITDLNFIRDYDYIEGAIIISYNDVEILGFRHWDLIDQLWSYIIDAIEQITEFKSEAYFYLPDQPVRIDLKLILKDYILLSIENEKQIFNKSELLLSLSKAAKDFWEIMEKCNDGSLIKHSKEQLKTINKIIKML